MFFRRKRAFAFVAVSFHDSLLSVMIYPVSEFFRSKHFGEETKTFPVNG